MWTQYMHMFVIYSNVMKSRREKRKLVEEEDKDEKGRKEGERKMHIYASGYIPFIYDYHKQKTQKPMQRKK